ncbi:MAG: hypothetical protein ACR2JE_17390 [Acidobacteriaceae bacterium]
MAGFVPPVNDGVDGATDLARAQVRLVLVWLIGALPSFVLVFAKTFEPGPPGLEPGPTGIDKIWSWLMPAIMPTLLLVVGTAATAAITDNAASKVNKTFYGIAIGISSFYLLVLFITILVAMQWSINSMDALDRGSLYLGPLQGLASASLGAFFVSKKK